MTQNTKKKVLVVDDQKHFCESVQELLLMFGDSGLEVTTCFNLAEGQSLCSETGFDIVLLDQKLPDGEGYELAPSILKKNKRAKIIFVTAYPSFDNAMKAIRCGAFDYLCKPFDIDELRFMVARAVSALESERQDGGNG